MASNIQSTNASSSPLISSERASALTSFMSSFYSTSDTPTAHEKYASEYFTSDATLIMGGKRVEGVDAVSSRKHVVSKIFFGGENDMMLNGTVAYVMKTASDAEQGKEVQIDWAGRAIFDDEGLKMKFYQVYLDTAAQQQAAAAAQKGN